MLEVSGWHKYEISKQSGFGTRITSDQLAEIFKRVGQIDGVYHCEHEDGVIHIESNVPIMTHLRTIIKDINNNQY